MKILLINTVCGTGSTGRIVSDLYHAYKDEGHQVKVIFGRGNALNVDETDAFCFNTKIDRYCHALLARCFDSQGLHSKRATAKIIAFIKKYSPDVIHLHNIHGYYLNYKMLFEYLNSSSIKVVWTLHDCWAFTGHCAYFHFNKCFKWKSECDKCAFRRDYPKSLFADKSRRNFLLKRECFGANNNLVIATPSQWLAKLVKESFLQDKKIEVINNGIDTSVFYPAPTNIKSKLGIADKKMLLCVANVWTAKKGWQDVLDISKKISDEWRVVMIGVSAKQKQTLPNNIIGVEKTNNQAELAEYYSAADVFFNPTYEDNFPTVNIEAKCCGASIVAYANTGGGDEIVDNSIDIILKERNEDNVLNAIAKASQERQKSEMKEAEQNGKYDKKNMLKQYNNLINKQFECFSEQNDCKETAEERNKKW
ncbi:MAG: glycosyltransferase [Clostridia bacterium]